MSFSTGCRKCVKCGKMYPMSLFDSGLCKECEKAAQESIIEELENMPCITPEEMQKCKDIVKKYTPKQEPTEKITLWGGEQFVSIETYQQVCKERDIAIEQLHELGYELGQKIEPCDDVVSRQAALDGIEELKQSPWATDKRGNGFEYLITEALDIVADLCVKQLPPVRPQEQTGHWVDINGGVECDKCGKWYPHAPIAKNEIKFCCNCGAKMVEPTCDPCKYNTATFMPCNACDNKSLFEPQESEETK